MHCCTRSERRFPTKKEDTVLQDHWMRNRSDQINHGPEQSAANCCLDYRDFASIHKSIQASKSNEYLKISTANMLGGRNASQPTGFHLRHCWHHVFWLHLFALHWRQGRWISHYSEITVLWISVQVSVEYSQITKIIESNLSLKTTRQSLTTVTRISKQPTSLIRAFSTRMISKRRHICIRLQV